MIRFGAGIRRADQEGDFPANWLLLHANEQFGQVAAQKFLVDLCHFAGNNRLAATQRVQCIRKGVHKAMGSFVERPGCGFLWRGYRVSCGERLSEREGNLQTRIPPNGSPEAASAATTAEGPGIGTTGICLSRHRETNRWPGSEITGVPASLTRTICAPCSSRFSNSSALEASLCW